VLPQLELTALSRRVAFWLAMPGVVVAWLVTGFPDLSSPGKGGVRMAIDVGDDFMFLAVRGSVVAIARFTRHAADGHGAWIVLCLAVIICLDRTR
jgi:hypothetical protein